MNQENDTKKSVQNEIEESIDKILMDKDNKHYNFLINASNQANLTGTYNISPTQINSMFVVVSPYYIEKFTVDGLDIDIKFDEDGTISINNNKYQPIEVAKGISVFGVTKQNKE